MTNIFQWLCQKTTHHKFRKGKVYSTAIFPTEYHYQCKLCRKRFWNFIPYDDAPPQQYGLDGKELDRKMKDGTIDEPIFKYINPEPSYVEDLKQTKLERIYRRCKGGMQVWWAMWGEPPTGISTPLESGVSPEEFIEYMKLKGYDVTYINYKWDCHNFTIMPTGKKHWDTYDLHRISYGE